MSYSLWALSAAPRAAVDWGILTAVTGLPSSSAKMSVMASLLATPPEKTMGSRYCICAERPMARMRRAMDLPVPAAMSSMGIFCER